FHGTVAGHLLQQQAYSVIAPTAGSLRWEINDRPGTGPDLFLLQPGQHYYGESEGLGVNSANLGADALGQIARTVYGDERLMLGFGAPHPVSAQLADYWQATYRFVHDTLTDPATADIALLRADVLRRLAVATLEAFPLTGDPHARRETVAARQGAYTAAVEFIHAAVSLPITLEDVARHAGVSTIELVRVFRAHAGITPGAYLRGVRMAAAHQDLVAADPTAGDTVGAIAARWGFPHPGDFARRHRAAYGVPPSHTLGH
ncbi:helix-turn-helix transcriptional regulator, partial [Kocuria dechangensis]|uniref:helix-turn-helix transcriptional regulator n=1 Tax=Kocuria dechangensis TaxID=1176249 RepID=UPI001665435E